MSDLRDKRQRDYENLVESMGLKVKIGEAVLQTPDLASVPVLVQAAQSPAAPCATLVSPSHAKAATPLPTIKKAKSTSPAAVQRHSFYRKLSGLENPAILDDKAADAEAISPTARYVTQTKELNIIPNTIISTVVESVEKNGCVELSSSSLGDDMAVALSHSISVMFVLNMDVSRNHITDRGVGALLGSLDPHVITDLNLAFVKMKKKPIEVLSDLVGETSTLERLVMEKCDLDDSSLRTLSTNIATQMCLVTDMPLHLCTLTKLNLSHNKFGDSGAIGLAEGLKKNASLTELDLSYNLIRGKGGVALFEALNDSIVCTLDLAYNALREKLGKAGLGVAKAVAACLEENDSLVHLSLAYAGFGEEDCKVIGEGLRENQVLMGLHMEENWSDIDAHGYMVGIGEEGGEGEDEAGNGPISSGARGITCNPAPLKMGHTFTRILPWAHPKISTAGEKWDKNNAGKCWICDRWTEVKFCIEVNDIEWVGGETIEGGNQIVEAQICTNFDSWKFETMSKGDRKGEMVIHRMVPPGRVGWFFNMVKRDVNAKVYEEDESEPCLVVRKSTGKERVEVLAGEGDGMFEAPPAENHGNVELVNVMDVKPRLNVAHEEIKLRPRSKNNETVVMKKKRKLEWTMKNSVFAAYQLDTKQHLEQAFESDYKKTKTGRSIEKLKDLDEKAAFKENLMMTFPVLKDVFRQYGAAYTSEVWNVGVNAWNQFVTDIKIVDEGGDGANVSAEDITNNKVFSRVQADLIFVSACGTGSKTLNRYQFLDAICQIANSKYIRFGECKTMSEAVGNLCRDNITKHAERDTETDFREKKLYNKTSDRIYVQRKAELMNVFKKFSGKEDKPGEAKTMGLSEYLDMIETAGIDNDITERNLKLAFVRSKETSVDENSSKSKHKQLKFVEFLETIGRLANFYADASNGSLDFHSCLYDTIQKIVGE